MFNAHELELLISGLPEIDVEDLRAHSEYSGELRAGRCPEHPQAAAPALPLPLSPPPRPRLLRLLTARGVVLGGGARDGHAGPRVAGAVRHRSGPAPALAAGCSCAAPPPSPPPTHTHTHGGHAYRCCNAPQPHPPTRPAPLAGTSKVPLDGFKGLQGVHGPQKFQAREGGGGGKNAGLLQGSVQGQVCEGPPPSGPAPAPTDPPRAIL